MLHCDKIYIFFILMLDKTCDRCTEYGYGGIIFLYKLQLRM